MEAIKLNLVPSDLTKPICHASQFDDGREIMLMLYDGQMPYVLSDEEIELDVKKLDGNIVTTDLTVESGTNYVIMVTTEQMCAIAGRNNCELKVQKNGKTIYSKNFYLAVEESATAGGIESASQINNLQTQIAGMVEDAVENQYDSENVLFDSEPTEGHGTGYTVTSAGIKAAIDAAGGNVIDDTTPKSNKTYSSEKVEAEINNAIYNRQFVALTKQYTPGALTNNGYVVTSGAGPVGFSVSEAKAIDRTARYIIIPYDFTPRADTHCVINFYSDVVLGSYISGISGSTSKGLKVAIPSNANYFRITCPDSETNWGVEYQLTKDVDYITDRLYSKGAYTIKGDMTIGSKFEIPQTNCKDNQVYSFTATADDFSNLNLIIGHGKTAYESCYITITPTNCDFTRYTTSANTTTNAHGLTLSQFIDVKIVVKSHGTANITIQTADDGNGVYEYSLDVTNWTGCSGDSNNEVFTFAELVSGTLTDCVFSWSCSDFRKQLWAFGDSYFAYLNTRWLYYLAQDGFYDNILVNGQSGENSTKAIIALKNMLEYFGKPKYILWCMGQNDGSDTTVANYNNWVTKIEEVINICKANDITPILCTIPSVPKNGGRSHESKNAWIRSSGYRYVDMAKAVGAEWNNGSVTWYPSMLASDNEHPDVEGGKAIEKRMLMECPELTFSN